MRRRPLEETLLALRRLEQDERALYRRAAVHVQLEPVFGGRVDTAVDLRGTAALAHLLADPEEGVRS